MTELAGILRHSPTVLALISCVDSVLVIAGCALMAYALFGLTLRKNPFFPITCAVLNVVFGIAEPLFMDESNDFGAFLWATASLLIPFVSMALIFRGKGLWKAMLVAAGYAFAESLRFLVLLVFFGFDYTNRDDELELLVGIIIDLVFFGAGMWLSVRRTKKNAAYMDVTKNGAILFLLIVLSTTVFVATLLIIGSSFSKSKQTEFMFMLLNVPVITATVSFALMRFFNMKNQNENYKQQLKMQIKQFQWMEQMVEDVRMFRHDFPKKMRPLIAYLDEDRPEEAKKMAEQFSDFAARTGERYHTGNFRLDTVLFCEQQLAERENIKFDVPFDTVFPSDGIDPDDIYTIFPNALDNAIEACRSVPEEKRVISLRTRMDKQTVFVTIRNPVAAAVKTKDGLPQTTKTDKSMHGYGFRSIKKAAAKYGDDNVSFSAENGEFELRIFLNYN
ncbi:MAG: sensor histidine kinase [Clostridia bacterium]|nr:sensor histidine kinase [Clostridia bacterium]